MTVLFNVQKKNVSTEWRLGIHPKQRKLFWNSKAFLFSLSRTLEATSVWLSFFEVLDLQFFGNGSHSYN